MVFELPCKLGEEFMSLKFMGWVDGKRIYQEYEMLMLIETEKSLYDTVCIGRTKWNETRLLSCGEYGKQYTSCYNIYIDDKYFEYHSLAEWGFPSEKQGVLIGVRMSEGFVVAHFCVKPRYEHIYFAIKDLEYDSFNNVIVYDEFKEKQRILQKKKQFEEITHSEEAVLDKNEKEQLTRAVINTAKDINLKLRKSDIRQGTVFARREKGVKKLYCIIDIQTLGERKKKVPAHVISEHIAIKQKEIIFKF